MANPLMVRKGNCTPGAAVTAACATNLGFEGSLQAEWATNLIRIDHSSQAGRCVILFNIGW